MWAPVKLGKFSKAWTALGVICALAVAGVILYSPSDRPDASLNQIEKSQVVRKPLVNSTQNQTWLDPQSTESASSSAPTNPTSPVNSASEATATSPAAQSFWGKVHSQALRRVLGLEGKGTYQERSQALTSLKAPLVPEDLQSLYGFLSSSTKVDGVSDAALHALKDGIMVFLAADGSTLGQSMEVLRQIYLDPNQDNTIRSYAMQYMVSSLPKLSDETQQAKIQKLIEDTASDPTQVGSRAALLGLGILVSNGSVDVSKEDLSRMALNIASDKSIPELERMHPLLVSAEMNNSNAAPVARDLAVNGQAAMVRMAACATLGQVGDSSDFALLNKAASDPDERIRSAATAALKALSTKYRQ